MQRVAVDLHRTLSAHPEVQVTTLALETSWGQTGIRTGPFLVSLLRKIPEVLREERIQVVLFSSMVTASVVAVLGDRIRATGAITAAIPVGRDVTLPNRVYQRVVPRVLRKLDLILPISRATAGAALERGAAPARVHVVPCGVNVPARPDAATKATRRTALLERLAAGGHSVPDDALLLLSVGRHQERKGFHWFVAEVMPRLPESAVYLLGGTGPLTAEIAWRVTLHGLGGRVHLLGQVSEETLRTLYEGADLFVMPNIPVAGDIEGFGVVMLEAGAAGLPVVAADLEGIRDVIATDENGWLIPSGDAAAFEAEIVRFTERNDHKTVSARADRYVRARYGWESIVEQYLEIFRTRTAALDPEQARNSTQNRQEPAENLRD
jgi:phosphatidylinositol alpha-1,6-mannosyltransferase